jgi:hypothetical protein
MQCENIARCIISIPLSGDTLAEATHLETGRNHNPPIDEIDRRNRIESEKYKHMVIRSDVEIEPATREPARNVGKERASKASRNCWLPPERGERLANIEKKVEGRQQSIGPGLILHDEASLWRWWIPPIYSSHSPNF